MSSNLRMEIATQWNQPATRAALEQLGLIVSGYGQDMLTSAARELLRGVPTRERWVQDFIVQTPAGRTVLVDSKFSFPDTVNHSIEMRSVLVAGQSDMPTFYVLSTWQAGGVFVDFTAMHYQEISILAPSAWPCCGGCQHIFTTDSDPMRSLPERCPNFAGRGTTASGTSFFVVKPPFRSLAANIFDIEPYFLGRPSQREWDRNIVVREANGRSKRVPFCEHDGCCAVPVRRYLSGYRCSSHTPAALAGHSEPPGTA